MVCAGEERNTNKAVATDGSRLAHTPIKVGQLLKLLILYPHVHAARRIRDGFLHGFRLGFTGNRTAQKSRNLSSIKDRENTAEQKIMEEVSLGRVAGPFKDPPFPNFRSSPIGLVPKHEPGKFRLIHHLSWPEGSSVNDGIGDEEASTVYTTLDQVMDRIMRLGKGTWLAKADIQSAFRLLPVHPDDFCLLGFTFGGKYYYDMCLPFGCRSSPAKFEEFSTFLNWCIQPGREEDRDCAHYADDFLIMGAANTDACLIKLNQLQELCVSLGVPLAPDKFQGPSTQIKFLGLLVDTQNMQVKVPPEKIHKAALLLTTLLSRRRIRLRELQSVIGLLNFLCRAVRPGRAFLQRLVHLTRGVKQPFHCIRLTLGAKADATMWLSFLRHYNGVTAFPTQVWEDSSTLKFFTDASTETGYGAYFNGHWFNGHWPADVIKIKPSIAWCELYPIAVALEVWGQRMQNKRVKIFTDNQSICAVINKQSSTCPRIMALVRSLTLICLHFNIFLRSQHIRGLENVLGDQLSRHQMAKFRQAAPAADEQPTEIPRVHEFLSAERWQDWHPSR